MYCSVFLVIFKAGVKRKLMYKVGWHYDYQHPTKDHKLYYAPWWAEEEKYVDFCCLNHE